MTEQKDEALTINHPRLLSAIYFALLAVIANIVVDSILYSIGVQQLLPFFQALILAAVIAGAFGALFGKPIIHCPKPYKTKVFLWGFLMVITALPVHTLGFLYFFSGTQPHLFDGASLMDLIEMYLLVLFYSFILIGFWLGLLAGAAAIYLRGRLAYHMLNALYVTRKPTADKEKVVKPKTAKYGQATITTNNHSNHT
ncbi:hypothetical protein [Legionella impletisoli]|uniref:Uncharacterized protein n=1 Tax=Legionella impletisoli TaxID=343510 RepID=A0A917JX38_9GAMM|nr:hypothetical protein [Legionella impletisoli]GGI89403.1 hypothetical protein GCM10007966_17650 [Legionella impletisoli]